MRRGGTRAGFKVWLEGGSCVCGRTSSFPAGERNQRLPGAGEVSMRHAGPRTGFFQNGLLYKIAQFQHIATSCLAGIDHEAGMLYAHLCIADAGTFQTALVDQK